MDDIRPILRLIGTLARLGYGLASLFAPQWIARLIAFDLPTSRGVTEFRVLSGGFLVGLGVWALLTNNAAAYGALGAGWLGAALARLFGSIADKPTIEKTFIGYWALEISMGLFLLV